MKSKKLIVFMGLILVASLVVLAGCGAQKEANTGASTNKEQAESQQKPIQLTLSNPLPATHPLETEIFQGWIKAIDEATNGRVKITSFPAGTLLPAQETYDGVVKGVADIGFSAYAYNRGRFPVVETFLLPGLTYNNSEAASRALQEGIEKLNPKELQDTHHLFSFATGPGDLMTTKKAVRNLEDLKGLQIGATAGIRADGIQVLGATPVVMPMPDWYEALSKGIMDGGVSGVETLKGFRLGEVTAKYLTLTPFLYNQLFYVTMNKSKWESLPSDIQKVIIDATKKFYQEKVPGLYDRLNKASFEVNNGKKKIEVITLPPEEQARWIEKIKPLQDKYVQTLNEKGLTGEEILKTTKELVDKYNKQFPVAGQYMK